MQNNSNRCPFCAEKDLRIDGTCTHTPTGSPSTPPPAERCPSCGESDRTIHKCNSAWHLFNESAEPAAEVSRHHSLADLRREFERDNFHHVNDTNPDKVMSSGYCADVVRVIAAYDAVCAERDEQQGYAIKFQREADQLRRELEEAKLRIGREDLLREMLTNSQAECERLRAACKRNPSSGSCIEALAALKGSGASGRADT